MVTFPTAFPLVTKHSTSFFEVVYPRAAFALVFGDVFPEQGLLLLVEVGLPCAGHSVDGGVEGVLDS